MTSLADGRLSRDRLFMYDEHLSATSRKPWYRLSTTVDVLLNEVDTSMVCMCNRSILLHVSNQYRGNE